MTDNSENRLEPKEIIVIVPLVAGSLAVSWEIGRYTPFGGFDLFTIPEHLLAAVGYLPVAMLLTVFMLLTVLLVRDTISNPSLTKMVLFAGIAGALFIGSMVAGYYFPTPSSSYAIIVTGTNARVRPCVRPSGNVCRRECALAALESD